ncbi:heavy metal translocating P-type ATPase [uncultured Sulfitobacter sp.]|uniref:heavy metal translocating P-type ATPase n=1 Tax=Sulfitobacter sp. SH22 TaxID=3421172 RepID=UPI0025D8F3D7|nr:heavy metal translocating P-type ATPase [uncultured Sulfitobacter sp.]
MTMVAACPGCAAAPMALKHAENHAAPALVLSLPTIHCAACIGKVERKLNALPQVDTARVNLSLKQLSVHGADVDADTIVAELKSIGYEAYPLDATLLETRQDTVGRNLMVRLAVAGFAMMNVMLFSVAIWSGASDTTRELFHLISATISLPAVLYCGQPFFASAWSALRVRGLNMDVPISLAILLATGMSLFEVMNGGAHAYFDAALSLTFFLLIGRYLDHHTRSSVRSAAKELAALEVRTAQRIENGEAVKTPVSELAVGDRLLIPSGVRVPVDGTLDSTQAISDRSFLTGESAAITLAQGQQVQAGEINLGAPFEMTATAVGDDTTLRRVATLVEMAENSRNSYTNLADRAARIYAPAVHLLAFISFLAWVWINGDVRHALNIAVAVLIITCPCALGLAVPAVATAAIGRLYSMGFLVKSGTALERLAEVDIAIFDKTGTLTLAGANARLDSLTSQQAAIVKGLAQASDHPVSRALVAALPTAVAAPLTDIAEVGGSGMQALYKGQTVQLGRGDWIGASFNGLGLKVGDDPAIALPLRETPREGVEAALNGLRDLGVPSQILSGDKQDAVSALALQLGVKDIQAEISATDKHAYLSKLQHEGHHVVMVGDGLNDTAALAAAHASVAPSSALDASRNAADVVMLRESLDGFPLLIRIARSTSQLSKQNFAIAAGYNAIAIPVALLGYATPLLAAIAMSASSITVIANAMRVRFIK